MTSYVTSSTLINNIPNKHRSVMGIGMFDNSTYTVNSRCGQNNYGSIYIVFNFNNLNNNTEYNLCYCYQFIENCFNYNNVQFY